MDLIIPRVVFVGGKGGVGKSTISSAIALKEAREGAKSLLISTDPAHNLSDIFHQDSKGQICEIEKNLFFLEINPHKEAEKYINQVAKDTKKFVSPTSYAMLDAYYQAVSHSGSAQESALFDCLIRIIVTQKEWDKIIIDTAPTGHTLRLFGLPQMMREWSKTLLSEQERGGRIENILGHIEDKNPLEKRIEERYLLYTRFQNCLKDTKECGIIFVLNTDYLSLMETQRAIQTLQQENLNAFALIVNKIPPQSSDTFFMERYLTSKQYLEKILSYFRDYTIWQIPLKSQDILQKEDLMFIMQDLH